MNYNKKTIMDVDVAGKKILLRCDFNVPQDKETHAITSDKRIVASLPTIRYLLERGAAVIACSHLGKPKGQWKDSLTLRPVGGNDRFGLVRNYAYQSLSVAHQCDNVNRRVTVAHGFFARLFVVRLNIIIKPAVQAFTFFI